MSIEVTCECGAEIRLPDSAAGRRARCSACGRVLSVPTQGPESLADPEWSESPESSRNRVGTGDWLAEFGRHPAELPVQPADAAPPEPSAIPGRPRPGSASARRPAPPDTAPVQPAEASTAAIPLEPAPPFHARRPPRPVHAASRAPDILAPVETTPPLHLADTDDDEPERSFWGDLAASFMFFAEPENFLTFLLLTALNALPTMASLTGAMLLVPPTIRPVLIFVALLQWLVLGYIFAVYLAIMVETAAGEDQLPSLWVASHPLELFMPVLRFVLSWVVTLLPAGLAVLLAWRVGGQRPEVGVFLSALAGVLAVVGVLVWPVVILAGTMGNSFRGMRPWTMVHTALVAPVPYLAVWGVLLLAALMFWLPRSVFLAGWVQTLAAGTTLKVGVLMTLLGATMSTYAAVVAMRAIGLYYRHYKRRFPWVAE